METIDNPSSGETPDDYPHNDDDLLIYTYHADNNPDGAFLSGVPHRNLHASDLADMPDWIIASIAACPWYARIGVKQTPRRAVPRMSEKDTE